MRAIFNAHTHIFTMRNAPEKFLNLYMPDVAAWMIDKITNTQPGSWTLQRLLSIMGPAGRRYAGFLKIGKSQSQAEVFENLMAQYTDDQLMKFVALCMYMENFGAGRSQTGYKGQIDEAIALKARYPERLQLFLGIDPRMETSGAALLKTVESYFSRKVSNGSEGQDVHVFQGLKIYPSTGFYIFDERLVETLEWAAENGVPVLSHCYYRGGIYNNDKSYLVGNMNPHNPYTGLRYTQGSYLGGKKWNKWVFGLNESYNNKNTCSYFLEPSTFIPVIEKFQGSKPLKLCLAHYGGSEMMLIQHGKKKPTREEASLFGNVKTNWYQQIRDMMVKYDGVYTDVAYTLLDKSVHDFIFADLRNPSLSDKILYGTDYFMTEKDQAEKLTYSNFKQAATSINLGKLNAWEKIASENTTGFLTSNFYSP